MSEMSLGPGWWQASNGRWYDPCLAPPGYGLLESANGAETAADAIEVIHGAPRVEIAPAGLPAVGAPEDNHGMKASFAGPCRPSMSFGWLGMALMGFVTLMAAALFILLIGVVVGGFLLALLIAVTALGVHRLWRLTGGRYQARRASLETHPSVPEVLDAPVSAPDRTDPMGTADGWADGWIGFNPPG